jgi:hypothetical protein
MENSRRENPNYLKKLEEHILKRREDSIKGLEEGNQKIRIEGSNHQHATKILINKQISPSSPFFFFFYTIFSRLYVCIFEPSIRLSLECLSCILPRIILYKIMEYLQPYM